jgi:hypothetical protein
MGVDLSGTVPWIATVAAALIGAWFGRRLQREDTRQDRLRGLYADTIYTALMWTPPELGKRSPGQFVQPDPSEVNELIAKLMVEARADEDEVIRALLGVQAACTAYRIDKGNRNRGEDVPEKEVRSDRQHVYAAIEKLQAAVRKRLR